MNMFRIPKIIDVTLVGEIEDKKGLIYEDDKVAIFEDEYNGKKVYGVVVKKFYIYLITDVVDKNENVLEGLKHLGHVIYKAFEVYHS